MTPTPAFLPATLKEMPVGEVVHGGAESDMTPQVSAELA